MGFFRKEFDILKVFNMFEKNNFGMIKNFFSCYCVDFFYFGV